MTRAQGGTRGTIRECCGRHASTRRCLPRGVVPRMSPLARALRPVFFVFVCLLLIGGQFAVPRTSSAKDSAPAKPIATVTSKNRVWLRIAPGTGWTVVAKIKSGTDVTLLDG